MIEITEKEGIPCGVTMTFENGNTISIQFGKGNYSSNKQESKSSATSAEVAIFDINGDFKPIEGKDLIKDWCSADEIAKLIAKASKPIKK